MKGSSGRKLWGFTLLHAAAGGALLLVLGALWILGRVRLQGTGSPDVHIPAVVDVGSVLANADGTIRASIPIRNDGKVTAVVRVLRVSSPCCVRPLRHAVTVRPHGTESLPLSIRPGPAGTKFVVALLLTARAHRGEPTQVPVRVQGRTVPLLELVDSSGAALRLAGQPGQEISCKGWLRIREPRSTNTPRAAAVPRLVSDIQSVQISVGDAVRREICPAYTTNEWPVTVRGKLPSTDLAVAFVRLRVEWGGLSSDLLVPVTVRPVVWAEPRWVKVTRCAGLECEGHTVYVHLRSDVSDVFDVKGVSCLDGCSIELRRKWRADVKGVSCELRLRCAEHRPLVTLSFGLTGARQTAVRVPVLFVSGEEVTDDAVFSGSNSGV